jgi:integrase
MDQLMQENELELEPTDAAYKLLFGFVRRAMTEQVMRRKYRFEVGYDQKAFDPLFASVHGEGVKPALGAGGTTTVDQLIDKYRSDPARAGVSRGTWDKYNTVFRLMREELGAKKPIAEITREDFGRLRDILNVVPANTTKKYPGKTFAAVAELAKKQGLKPMSPTTANNHLHSISSIFHYAVKEELVDKNRAHGMRIARVHERRKEERRMPFDTKQLNSIFSAALFSDAKGKDGSALPRSGRFWVPLLSLWTGMRLNECCQLAVADVQNRDGTDFILVRETGDGEQRLKTKAATRTVPIHPELKRIGFLEFVAAQRKAQHKQLFPDLPKSVRGYYSDLFSKWFSRFLRSAGVKTQLTSFHSFRHNFRDALREAHVHPAVAKVLGGWEDTGTDATYGVGYKPATLAAELEKITYSGLDLSHLHR